MKNKYQVLTEDEKHGLVLYVQNEYYDWLNAFAASAIDEVGIKIKDKHTDACDDEKRMHMQVSMFVDRVIGEINADGFEKLTKIYGEDYVTMVK